MARRGSGRTSGAGASGGGARGGGASGGGASGGGARGRGFFERLMFSFMGPPQVGDPSAPARELPPRPVDLCRTCGQPRDDHEVVRSPTLTYTVCSGAPAAPEHPPA